MPSIPRWDLALGAFAVVAAVLGLVAFVDIRHQRAVGQEFLDTGVETVADQVEVRVLYGKGGSYIDEVEVTFVVAAERHLATLWNNLGDPEGNADGRHPPAVGTRYAAPLRILYMPDDPTQVVAAVDAEYFATDSGTPSGVAGLIAIGGTTVIAVLAGWTASNRLLGRRRTGAPSRRRHVDG